MNTFKNLKVWIGSNANESKSAFGGPSFLDARERFGSTWAPYSSHEFSEGLARGAEGVCAANHTPGPGDLKNYTVRWKKWERKVRALRIVSF